MTASKPSPGGWGSREWKPYSETSALPDRNDAAGGRDMSLLDSLAVMDAILYHSSNARLKGAEAAVLNSILHNTVRYGRLAPLRCSHRFLAAYSGVNEKRHGEPLKSLHEQGFIDYRKGMPTKDAGGHKNTQSEIRIRIPEGWQNFRDGSWNKKASAASPASGQGEEGEGHEDRDPHPIDLNKGHEDRDPVSNGASENEGHEDRDPEFAWVTESVTGESRSSLPIGHGDRESKSHGVRELKGHGVDTPNGVTSLKRGGSLRGALIGETQSSPPTAEPSVGDGIEAGSATPPMPSVQDSGSGTQPGSTHSLPPIVGGRNVGTNGETEAMNSARAALSALVLCVKGEHQSRLTPERQDEIVASCADLLERDPDIEVQDLHYLLGLWAGDRGLENANFLSEHMLRNKKHLRQVILDMEKLDDGAATAPDAWLKIGIIHGQRKRQQRQVEDLEGVSAVR